MSGYAAIFNLDGSPVDPALLERMQAHLALRGPDCQQTWRGGWNDNVGLVHAMLRTTHESEGERQPCTLEGSVWLAGHVRVDDRQALLSRIEAQLGQKIPPSNDAEIILWAYRAWGDGLASRLLGDYSFVIWDGKARRLLCARDHMGVRPLFYARAGNALVVSNTLACVGLNPVVSDALDDTWIADFLLFGYGLDPQRTAHAGTWRLQPGHFLVADNQSVQAARYWKLELPEPVYYKQDEEYCEHFSEKLELVVKDRIRTDRIGIQLSGGLDSTTLAATAARLVPNPSTDIVARCHVFNRLIHDDEERYCRMAADFLGIPLSIVEFDEDAYDEHWQERTIRTPEPVASITRLEPLMRHHQEMAAQSRVWFFGEGPDNALVFEWQAYLRWLLRKRAWKRMASDAIKCGRIFGVGQTLAAGFRKLLPKTRQPGAPDEFPMDWLRPSIPGGCDPRQRRQVFHDSLEGAAYEDTWHPKAYASFTSILWQVYFEEMDAAAMHAAMEYRHPYMDLRMLNFHLSVPILPWARAKTLTRRCMRSRLPAELLSRPKTYLRGHPYLLAAAGRPYPRQLLESEILSGYVDPARVAGTWPENEEGFYLASRLAGLAIWLRLSGK
jgi:asparagine synthase (glutamine-hydrolysing)